MNDDMIADIIAWGTVIVTVGFCVGFGIRAARRKKRHPRSIEYMDDGFMYYDIFGDTRVRWRDITSVEVKLETHRSYGGKYSRGKTTKYLVLDIAAGRKSFNIFSEDFENVNFDEFIARLDRQVRGSNPQFMGIVGNVDGFRKDIQSLVPEVDAEAEAEDAEFDRLIEERDRQVEARIAALGRPVSRKERQAILKEETRKIIK